MNSWLADRKMRSCAKSRSSTPRHRPQPSPLPTSRCPSLRLATRTFGICQRPTTGRRSRRQRRSRLGWRFGGVRRTSWRAGSYSGLNRTRSWGKSGSRMCCGICGRRSSSSSHNDEERMESSTYRRLVRRSSPFACDGLITEDAIDVRTLHVDMPQKRPCDVPLIFITTDTSLVLSTHLTYQHDFLHLT